MKEFIDVFQMEALTPKVRCDILIKLGEAKNAEYGMNLTEGLVYQLVKQLDPDHEILTRENFKRLAGVENEEK